MAFGPMQRLPALVALLLLAPAARAATFPTVAEVAEKAREHGPLTLLAAAEIKVAGSQKVAAASQR